MQNQYFEIGLEVFKTATSLPGLSKANSFRLCQKKQCTLFLDRQEKRSFFSNDAEQRCRGPSVIFHRQAEKGLSLIRQGKTCQKGCGRVVQLCWVNFQCRGVLDFDYSRARAYCTCSMCGWG